MSTHKGRIVDITKFTAEHWVNGCKKGQMPFNAIHGGNGSYCIDSEIVLQVKVSVYDLGNHCVYLNMYDAYRDAAGIIRITQSRLEGIREHIGDKVSLEFDDDCYDWTEDSNSDDAWSMDVCDLL